ncbi:MAG: hypothetical protein K6F88_04055 [Ruminococcus sp.]|nr:hypothetical protein [Ruminococcus sp.]
MDDFEKVNETLENEEIKSDAEVAEVSENEEVKADDEVTEVSENEEVNADTEVTEVSETEEPSETSDEVSEDIEADGYPELNFEFENENEQAPKKQFILQKTIIKAACILLAVLVVFGCAVLVKNIMTPSIEGVWRLDKVYMKGSEKDAQKMGTSAKEAVYYQIKSDGDFVFSSGTITQTMKWSYADEKGKATDSQTQQIIMYPKGSESYSTQLKWTCEGNALTEKKLTLETGTDTVQVNEFSSYNSSEIPEYKMPLDKKFKAVNDLVGTWYDKSSKQQIALNKDGSYVLTVGGYLKQTGNYKADTKKKTITLGFVSNGAESNTGALPYSLKDKSLSLANYTFTKTK